MASLRICAITFDWYPFDVLVRRTAEAAADAGYTVDVICLRQPGEIARESCKGVRVHRIPMYRSFGRSLPRTLLDWCCFLVLAGMMVTRLHLRRRYDVIHVHNIPDFLVFCALIPKLLGAKIILEVQDVSPELLAAKAKGRMLRGAIIRFATWQERLSSAFADHVITVGEPFARLLRKRGIPAEKLTIILNSADPKLFPPLRIADQSALGAINRPLQGDVSTPSASEERPFILMYHGTVAERNGLDTALRAFALARQVIPHLRFDIQGRGEHLPYVKQLAQALGVSERVVFTDPCSSDELVDFVLHGDVGIIPYRSDGFMDLVLPTKAYEFALMQRPIIASDTPAIRSMFRAESVMLCDPTNPTSFAEAIIDLYQHPGKREQLVASAAEDYRPYRWEIMAQRYQQLLLSLSLGRPAPGSVGNNDGRPALPLTNGHNAASTSLAPTEVGSTLG
jgi:glycosyltransferase involved in cell wall biosynthesis